MKIAVMGAGAVGCFFGALLAKAGHEVVLIGRARHVDAIRAEGLLLERALGRERVRLDASMAAHAVAGATLRLAQVIGRPVFPAAVYVAAEMAGPGHVRHHGRCELMIGTGPGGEELAETLREAGIQVEVSAEVETLLWAKLVVNCAYNALSAITRQPYGAVLEAEGAETLLRNILAECEAVAKAAGITLPAGLEAVVLQTGRDIAGQFSSTAQDIMRGRRTEIEYLNGHVVRLGAEHGVATPLNQALTVMVRLLEARE